MTDHRNAQFCTCPSSCACTNPQCACTCGSPPNMTGQACVANADCKCGDTCDCTPEANCTAS